MSSPPTIYRSVDAVLTVFNNHKSSGIPAISAILQAYTSAQRKYEEEKCGPTTKKHPLIILEGLDGCGKSTVGKKLAAKIGGVPWCTPPESIKPIRDLFDEHVDSKMRNAYYALGNYIAVLEVSVILKTQPVVMDRFWHSTSAYTLAQSVHDFPDQVDIPPPGDDFYQWPKDLLKPDLVLFLKVSEEVRLQRISRRAFITPQEELLRTSAQFRNNIHLIYENMVNPCVTFVNGDPGFKEVLENCSSKIEALAK